MHLTASLTEVKCIVPVGIFGWLPTRGGSPRSFPKGRAGHLGPRIVDAKVAPIRGARMVVWGLGVMRQGLKQVVVFVGNCVYGGQRTSVSGLSSARCCSQCARTGGWGVGVMGRGFKQLVVRGTSVSGLSITPEVFTVRKHRGLGFGGCGTRVSAAGREGHRRTNGGLGFGGYGA